MRAIGIDIGTTTISLVVFDRIHGAVVEARTVESGSFLDTGRTWEKIQDVPVIIGKARTILDELLEKYPEAAAIGLTGQMHGILYLNAEGTCVSPLYTWQDQRGELMEADGKTLVEKIREGGAVSCAAGYGLVTHCYQSRNGLVPKEAVSICTIADYLGMVLTGRSTPLLHVSMAASLGFFDVEHGGFQEDVLEKFGVESRILPQVTEKIAVLGNYRGYPVTVALGDNQASFLGAAGVHGQKVLLNMGTGGQISVLSEKYFAAPGIEVRPFLRGQYLLVGASLCGGRAYAVLENFFRSYMAAAGLGGESQYELMERLAADELERRSARERSAGESDKEAAAEPGMRVITAFSGTRTDPGARGSISGISETNFTPQGLILGVLDGMAQELYNMYEMIQMGAGITAEQMVASGNGVRKNTVLRKLLERKFGMKLLTAECEEEAACGAAISGMMAATDTGL